MNTEDRSSDRPDGSGAQEPDPGNRSSEFDEQGDGVLAVRRNSSRSALGAD
jgi:hypothetical protein